MRKKDAVLAVQKLLDQRKLAEELWEQPGEVSRPESRFLWGMATALAFIQAKQQGSKSVGDLGVMAQQNCLVGE